MKKVLGAIVLVASIVTLGCSTEETEPLPVPCPEGNSLGGVCLGVPAGPLCHNPTCNVAGCSSEIVVADDAQLTNALAGAAPGTCVELMPGSYTLAIVPSGVKLLGKGADFVTIGAVQLAAGSNTFLRGLGVTQGGIIIDGTKDAMLEAVRVAGSLADGIEMRTGASATVTSCEVTASARYALSAFDVASVSVVGSVITGANGPGVWAQCGTDGCDCATPLSVSVSGTIIRDTKLVGLSLVGVNATLDNILISDNTVNDGFRPGGGLAVSGCSVLNATDVQILDNTDFGVLVHESTASFQVGAAAIGLNVAGNLRGIWIQHVGENVPQSVTIDGASVTGNTGIGIGVDAASIAVSVLHSVVRDTSMIALPVLVGGVSAGAQNVGDGLEWLAASQLTIDGLTVSGSARQSVLIDGAVGVGSTISNVTLEGNDVTLGLLQQNYTDGPQPTLGVGVPPLTTSQTEVFSIAEGLGIPPEI